MNDKLVYTLVNTTKEWLDYLDCYGYHDAVEDDIIMAVDQEPTRDTFDILMNLPHYVYLEVINEVLSQLSKIEWEE